MNEGNKLEALSRPSASVEEINAALKVIWSGLAANPPADDNVDPALFQDDVPIVAEQEVGHFGVVETIIIAVVGGIAKDSVEGVWKKYVWPRLEKKLGAKLDPQS